MLWLILKDASYQITSCNVHIKDGKHQVWVERPNGRTLKVAEGHEDEVAIIKEAIDYAVKNGEKVLEI